MRYIGMFAIAIACAFLGWRSAEKLHERVRVIEEFIESLRRLKVEIAFSATPLEAAARNISSGSGHVGDFWREFADALLGGADVVTAWEWAMHETPMQERHAEILMAFASGLGRSDRASQCERIDATIEALSREVESLRAEAKEKGKVRKALGALAGAALIIILI